MRILLIEVPDDSLVHNFGFISALNRSDVQMGWLCAETLVELKLHDNAIEMWKKRHKNKDLFVKITPVDVNQAQHNQQQSLSLDLDESLDVSLTRANAKSWPIVQVAVLENNYNHNN